MTVLYDAKEFSSLSDMVYHHLYEAITDGRYHSGDLLIEMKIAEELGVSRTPVREALKQLEREDLVVSLPNRGVMVRGVTDEDLSDIYTIRALLEGQAAYWAAERITEKQLERMDEILELMDLYTRKNNVEHLVRLDTSFHEIIYDACRSNAIRNLLTNLHQIIRTKRMNSLTVEGRAPVSLGEHREIYEALKAHDAERAKRCAQTHINAAEHVTDNR